MLFCLGTNDKKKKSGQVQYRQNHQRPNYTAATTKQLFLMGGWLNPPVRTLRCTEGWRADCIRSRVKSLLIYTVLKLGV